MRSPDSLDAALVPLPNRADIAIVGGGLAGGLIALALARQQPNLHVELIDSGAHFGGNHVWSFFASDVTGEGAALLEPLIAARWDGYDVAFPAHRRTLATGYASLTSEMLDAELRRILGSRARSGMAVAALSPTSVTMANGAVLEAGAVIDARGAGEEVATYRGGWQKFVGQMLHLAQPHGLTRPIVMDATVEQIDGYRFVYVLPFGPDRLFVEDTYYSDTPELDRAVLAERIAAYALAKRWQVASVEREESGVLPVVSGGNFDRAWPADDEIARAGVRATLFHATTGYSLPQAVALALAIARDPTPDTLASRIRAMAADNWRRGGFYRLLDTMLFDAAKPDQRYRVLERFYRLSPGLINRFYAGKTLWRDRIRLLSGRPPVPITAAVRAILRGGSSDNI